MAIRDIRLDGDPALRRKSRIVEKFDDRLHELLDDMADTMYDAPGAGLAAPQLGIGRRVIVIDVGEGLVELVNPEIINSDGSQCDKEGCLSFPDETGYVRRPNIIAVNAQDRNGAAVEFEGEGYFAVALCHEIDHLDGVLFIDKIITPSEEELEVLRQRQKEAEDEAKALEVNIMLDESGQEGDQEIDQEETEDLED